jgi:ATP-dependent protease HslVU (ClpYQ) peptidase subunit
VGSSVVGGAGWGIYGNILVDFLRERPAPDLSGEQAIFSFFLELWRALHERYPFVNDQAQSRDTPFGDLDTSFLIANDSGIYKISHDMDVCRFQQYFAIGSGSEYALGALGVLFEQETDASAIVRRVVQIAMRFDAHCGGPIDVQSV